MKAFATFQKPDGSDAGRHLKLDGRSNINMQVWDCKKLIHQLRDEVVYTGFKIYSGDIKTNDLILTVVKNGDKWEIVR